jgi:uncharacterized protein (UPF0210 family)
MAIGVMNNKTTAVRIIPVPGREVGEMVEFGGLLGSAPIMAVNAFSSGGLYPSRRTHPCADSFAEKLTTSNTC